jgi:sec-independent protein translocase protein TatB
MLDMSWGEMMVIGAVALIVIGPKDLPKALRTLGNMISKVRRMAGEFQGQFREAIREAELDDVKRDLQGMNQSVTSLNEPLNPVQSIRDELKGAIETSGAPSAAASGSAVDQGVRAPPPAEPALAAPASSVEPVAGLDSRSAPAETPGEKA